MAAYCPASRRRSPPIPASSASHLPPQSRHSLIDLTDSSPTYIFPDPSSVPPSPNMSPSSHFSEWSDISSSVVSFSDFGSMEDSPLLSHIGPSAISGSRQPLNLSESLGSPTDVQKPALTRWKRQFVNPIQPEPAAKKGTPNPDASCLSLPAPNPETITSRLLNHSNTVIPPSPGDEQQQSLALHQAPFAHSSIPLLSFFASLLGVDDLTLDLLTLQTSSASIILPTEKYFDAAASNDVETPTALHGVEKLFSDAQLEMSYHHGLPYHKEIPIIPPVVLQRVITAFVSNGCRVWHHFSGRLAQKIRRSRIN